MSVFENFPYTNFHNLNLDWVLNKLKSFEERLNKIETNGGGTGGGTGGGSSIDVTALEAKIDAKQDKLTFDFTPTQQSHNPVTSGGIYEALGRFQRFQIINPVFDNSENGYTLNDAQSVTITDKSIFTSILNYLNQGAHIWSVTISLSLGGGLKACASITGPDICTFMYIAGYDHLLASCYQSSSNKILGFGIKILSDGLSIMFISPDPANITSIHVYSVDVNIIWTMPDV